ncbi:MAG: hypothetical protein AAGE65_08300 [Planctomycetota bacterium]
MPASSISPLAGPRFHYVTAVWGERFVQRFLDVVLPTNLSDGNLAALGDRIGDVYRLFTTPQDAQTIVHHPIYARLADLVEVRVDSIEPWLQGGLGKYRILGRAHHLALESALSEQAAAVFLSPDAVFADGAFARLRALTLQGKRRVLLAGVRAEASGWLRDIRGRCPQPPDQPWVITPRDAMAAALRHAHPWTRSVRWDAPRLNSHPSHLYFPIADADDDTRWRGAVCRAFHAHPLLVWPREVRGKFHRTVDGDLSNAVPAEPDEIHLITDSDELAAVELSDADAVYIRPEIPKEDREERVAEWSARAADADHWDYFNRPIRLRGDDLSEEQWAPAEQLAARVAGAVRERAAEIDVAAPLVSGPARHRPAAVEKPATQARLHFIVPVWGEAYIERFLRWGLPSFLASGNLPAVADRTHSFDIVTDRADLPLFEHPAIDRLRSLVPVQIRTPAAHLNRADQPDDSLGYLKMTRYYNAAVTAQTDPAVAHVFLTPEGVFSDGLFTALLKRLDAGIRAVALPGFRVLEETAIDALLAEHLGDGGLTLAASPRQLVRWVMEHPHPITVAHAWGEAWDHVGPRLHPHYYWPVDGTGFVAHCLHVHPLCVWPNRPGQPVPPGQTLDHEYLQQAVPYAAIHLVTDTDEMCVIDIARDGHLDDSFSDRPYGVRDVAEFAGLWTNGYHRGFFERPIRVHTGALGPHWHEVEAEAKHAVTQVLRQIARGVEMPFYAKARATVLHGPSIVMYDYSRPRWVRFALSLERRQASLRRRVKEVGWWKVFAIRTRARRLARRAIDRVTLSPEDRGRGRKPA